MIVLLFGFLNQTSIEAAIGTRVGDVNGELHQIGITESILKPSVFVFLSPSCDDNGEVHLFLQKLASSKVVDEFSIYGVISDTSTNWKQARTYTEQASFNYPLILDTDKNLAKSLKPSHLPEAIVISKQAVELSRSGASDVAAVVTVMEGISKGETLAPLQIDPKIANGCKYDALHETAIEDVTYNRHIAPIMQANCMECHRPRGIAPFALEKYEQTRNLAPVIAYVTKEGIMPPWRATPRSGHFLNERLLSKGQISLLEQWSKEGAPEGDPNDTPPQPKIDRSEWRLGEPDIVIEMPEGFDVPSSGPDIYRYFVVNDAIPRDLQIAAIDFRPGDPSVVHHCNFFVDYGNRARKLDAKDPKPGFSVFGTGGLFSYWDSDNSAAGLGAWAPGGNPIRYPDGMGIKLPGGADFVFEIHYHPTGKKAHDRSQFGIYLADKPIKNEVSSLFMGTDEIVIPAGEKDFKRHYWMVTPTDMQLVDIAPHMHYLGKHVNATATFPNGEKRSLLDANWDFRWQSAYYFREPLELPKGTRIDVITSYDNSSDNPYNPYSPPVEATWGWGTDQEMGELYLTVLSNSNRDLKKLQAAAHESWYRSSDPELVANPIPVEKVIGELRTISIWQPRGVSLLRTLYSEEDRFRDAIRHLKRQIRKNPKDPTFRSIIGALYGWGSLIDPSLLTKWNRAYEKALSLDPKHWDSLYAMAVGYAETEEPQYHKYAMTFFKRLIELQTSSDVNEPKFVKVYQKMGELLERMGLDNDAAKVWKEGIRRFPRNTQLLEKLGLNSFTTES